VSMALKVRGPGLIPSMHISSYMLKLYPLVQLLKKKV
jgi:hypothetical protein